MAGQLNTDSFEHFFNERVLKKGWAIYEKSRIRYIGSKAGNEYEFVFKSAPGIILNLKKKGNKILKYVCSCGSEECEHLCAALFFLLRDKIDLKVLRSKNRKKSKRQQPGIKLLQSYNKKLRNIIKKMEDPAGGTTIKEKQSEEIVKLFSHEIRSMNPVISHLAILNVLPGIFATRKSSSGEIESESIGSSLKELDRLKRKGLTVDEKEAWMEVTMNSVKNRMIFRSGIFFFLIPRALSFVKSKKELDVLNGLLIKRTIPRYGNELDILLIARFQLSLKSAQLFNGKLRAHNDLNAELSVAKAELKFASNRTNEGFKILRHDYEKLKKNKPVNFINYLEYLVRRSRELKNPAMEIFFSGELILNDTMVSEKQLNRLKEIMDDAERKKFIGHLLNDLKKKTPGIHSDKILRILESENRLDELLAEASKHPQKFTLINRVAIKKLPEHSSGTWKIYAEHLVNALYEAREPFHQKRIFDNAKKYFDGLSQESAAKLISKLLEKISRNNFIYGLLEKYIEARG